MAGRPKTETAGAMTPEEYCSLSRIQRSLYDAAELIRHTYMHGEDDEDAEAEYAKRKKLYRDDIMYSALLIVKQDKEIKELKRQLNGENHGR